MTLIKILILLSIISLCVRIYYSIKLEDINKSNASILGKMIGGVFGGGVIFPILRKPTNSKERILIRNANIAVILFWSLFIVTMPLIILVPT